jgi:hypothetical protein
MRALVTVLKVPPVNPISAHDNPTEIERAAPHCGPFVTRDNPVPDPGDRGNLVTTRSAVVVLVQT